MQNTNLNMKEKFMIVNNTGNKYKMKTVESKNT